MPDTSETQHSHMKKILPRLIILAVAAAIGVGGWYLDAQRAKARSVLSGYFESEPSELSSRVQGRVASILVHEGQAVHAGDPLVVLDATPESQNALALQAKADQARQQLIEAQNGPTAQMIRQRQAAVAEQSATLAKLRAGSRPQELGQAQAALREAQANLQKVVDGPRPQEIAQARAAAQGAKARLDELQNGNTKEDIAQAKARLDSAIADEDHAATEAKRYDSLLAQDAVTRQDRDRAATTFAEAQARRREIEQAYRTAVNGPRPEEIAQAREGYKQAQAALDLALAGSRAEDKQAARARVAQAQQALDLLRSGTRPEDIAAGVARLAQAQASLDDALAGVRKEEVAADAASARSASLSAASAQSTVEDRTIRAPRDGVVERTLAAVGDLVKPGQAVVRFDDPSDIWIRVYVPQEHLSQTRVGDEADIHVDGMETPVEAVVVSIATQGEFTPANLQTPEERGLQVFAVRLRLRKPDIHVKAGMYATVTRIGEWRP